MGLFDMFNSAIKAERQAVKQAKADLKELVKERDRSLKDAESALKNAKKDYDGAVLLARGHLASLKDPGKGKRLDRLGDITLYQKVVEMKRGAMPLAGLSVRVESAPTASYIYLEGNDGQTAMASFSTELRDTGAREDSQGNVWVNQKRDFNDGQVRALAAAIQAAVTAEDRFQEKLPQLLEEAIADLAAKESATAPVDAAQEALDRLTAEHPLTPRIQAAEAELASAEQVLEQAREK
jgi:hypothetical protein